MQNRRCLRRLSALLACAALLFCRVAVAAFACPAGMLAAPAATMAACHDAAPDAADPLCQKSCNDDPQKFEDGSSAALAPAIVSPLYVIQPGPVAQSFLPPAARLARANAPPLVLLFGRLRE